MPGVSPLSDAALAAMIDHTLLKTDATKEQLLQVCEEAKQYGFAAVCVYPVHISLVAEQLQDVKVKPITVVSFPKGDNSTEAKVSETREAISAGAVEIDMVINIPALKTGDYQLVYKDIKAVVEAAAPHPVKVIIETAQLEYEEKIAACVLARAARAAFVKTSTGFGGGGATVEDVALMCRFVGREMGVKASAGIRSREAALQMVAAGARRIGTSSGVAIMNHDEH